MIPRSLIPYGIALLAAAGVAAGLVKYGYEKGQESRDAEVLALGLRADSAIAAADTTRTIYEDSLHRIQERRSIQVAELTLERDRALRDLGFERAVTSTLIAEIRAIEAQASAPVTVDSQDVRRATIVGTSEAPPATITADVEMSADSAHAQFAVELQPIPITIDDVCAPVDPRTGVRPSSVQVTSPAWVRLQVSAAAQLASICNPVRPRVSVPSRTRWFIAGAGTAVLLLEYGDDIVEFVKGTLR